MCANEARADRRRAGRDKGTIQVICNHAVVRSLSPSNIMAKVTLRSDLRSISGRIGNIMFKTYTKSDGSKETRAYSVPCKTDGSFGYERTTPLSPKEIETRKTFQIVNAALKAMTPEQKDEYYRMWKNAGYKFNGKKYATLRGYIMARLHKQIKDGVNLV